MDNYKKLVEEYSVNLIKDLKIFNHINLNNNMYDI